MRQCAGLSRWQNRPRMVLVVGRHVGQLRLPKRPARPPMSKRSLLNAAVAAILIASPASGHSYRHHYRHHYYGYAYSPYHHHYYRHQHYGYTYSPYHYYGYAYSGYYSP